ncbi:hypothetical protein GQ53DRAFT_771862 [Thozetella sp. PMI_491]|nr:hypothetical protein GQ53DRAFT_771862 [Thozetella sp. PMI_491]
MRTSLIRSVFSGPLLFNPPLQNFTQKLEHASSDNVTFQQQYQLNTTHFRPGGPILFHQSEELPVVPVELHVFADYAEELGAIITTLEHRYFGKSFPDGMDVKSNITKATFAPLTLDNVLQDAVEYVNWIRKTVPGAENSPVIYSGGSYGGFLSVMARVRHPETFHGALAISPVVRGFGVSDTVEDNPYKFAATDWVANIYWDANAEASYKIKHALSSLAECAKVSPAYPDNEDLNH